MGREHNHYFKSVEGLTHIDVYLVLILFAVTDPCIAHAVKKLLVPGRRGAKDIDKDVKEAIDSLKRFQEIRAEQAALAATNAPVQAPSEQPEAAIAAEARSSDTGAPNSTILRRLMKIPSGIQVIAGPDQRRSDGTSPLDKFRVALEDALVQAACTGNASPPKKTDVITLYVSDTKQTS